MTFHAGVIHLAWLNAEIQVGHRFLLTKLLRLVLGNTSRRSLGLLLIRGGRAVCGDLVDGGSVCSRRISNRDIRKSSRRDACSLTRRSIFVSIGIHLVLFIGCVGRVFNGRVGRLGVGWWICGVSVYGRVIVSRRDGEGGSPEAA